MLQDENVIEDGISFDYAMRRDVDGSNDPMLVTFLESGGWSCVENSASTVAVYTDEGNFTTTADTIGADTEGQYILVELNSGAPFWATQISARSDWMGPISDGPISAGQTCRTPSFPTST